MGHFYFDESIHQRGDFILGAWVYSNDDLSPQVLRAIEAIGLTPCVDEFKSGRRMDREPKHQALRDALKNLLHRIKLGLVIIPMEDRSRLGDEALLGLNKIIRANDLIGYRHEIFFDQGVDFRSRQEGVQKANRDLDVEIQVDQDSRTIAGLQMADLAAHTMSVMLLETLGLVNKKVKAGPDSGYDPDLDIEIGFEMWATLRYQFFTQGSPDLDADPIEGFILDTATYALYVSEHCSEHLRDAAMKRFGTNYVGCIH
jgi:hypothetical protein